MRDHQQYFQPSITSTILRLPADKPLFLTRAASSLSQITLSYTHEVVVPRHITLQVDRDIVDLEFLLTVPACLVSEVYQLFSVSSGDVMLLLMFEHMFGILLSYHVAGGWRLKYVVRYKSYNRLQNPPLRVALEVLPISTELWSQIDNSCREQFSNSRSSSLPELMCDGTFKSLVCCLLIPCN